MTILSMPGRADAPPTIAERVRRQAWAAEWGEFRVRWDWLLDSLEGGMRYRNATYGAYDVKVATPIDDPSGMSTGYGAGTRYTYQSISLQHRNLIRHAREVPPARESESDDYRLRLERTPVPTFVADSLNTHLSRIYAREVERDGPDALKSWWADVDGKGTPIDRWMLETVAPLLLLLGQIDLAFDHPAAPDGAEIRTRADAARAGVDACVASVILPTNMLWWELDRAGRYAECLVAEGWRSGLGGGLAPDRVRHWTAEDSTLYDARGEVVEGPTPHPFGRVPIVRVFDQRKHRCGNVGQSDPYEAIAELQREYYNAASELILTNTLHAHPSLQGPEDYVGAGDDTIPVGPSFLLPMKKGASGDSYTGFGFVSPPTNQAELLIAYLERVRGEVERLACLIRPAGASPGRTTAQSGISKQMDMIAGNDLLAKKAKALQRAEAEAARLALTVLADGDPADADLAALLISYASEFDLHTAADLGGVAVEYLSILPLMGELPGVDSALLRRLSRLMLPGLADAEYAGFDADIDGLLARKAAERVQAAEGGGGTLADLGGQVAGPPAVAGNPSKLLGRVPGAGKVAPDFGV